MNSYLSSSDIFMQLSSFIHGTFVEVYEESFQHSLMCIRPLAKKKYVGFAVMIDG